MPYTRRQFLRQFLPLAAAGTLTAQPPRPNVLFVVVDDLDCRVGCYGDRVARTPHIDSLAARGVRFDRAYCQFPLCNPTRSSVLSGRYPTSTGVLDNNTWLTLRAGEQMLPAYFAGHGYGVATHGKIWHGPNRGFAPGEALPPKTPQRWVTPADRARQQRESPAFWEDNHTPYRNLTLPAPRQYAWANNYGPLPEGDPGVDAPIADAALKSMERMAQSGQPFFLAVGFHRPHVPLTAPMKYFDLFDPEEMPLPPDFDTEPRLIDGVPRDEFRSNIDLFAGRAFTVQEAREAMRAYYASMAYMDDQVGRLLGQLKALELDRNTIVILWGDHGWHLGEKGMWAKGTLFETSARGPMIVADPRTGFEHGAVCRRIVQYLDIAPTLVDLAGLPACAWHQGTALRPLLVEPTANWDRPAITVQVRSWFVGRSIRTERWRYTEWDEGRRGRALYDHDTDPHEMRNLAAVDAHAGTVAALSKELKTFRERTEPRGP